MSRWRRGRRRFYFLLLLPGLWTAAATGSTYHVGDEYGMLLVSAIAGFWPLIVFKISVSRVQDAYPLMFAVGIATMLLVGWLFDRARAPRIVWTAGWAGLAAIIAYTSIASYPTVARAISKNGSIEAYVYAACNLSLYLTTLLVAPIAVHRWWTRPRPAETGCLECGYDLTGNTSGRCPECGAAIQQKAQPTPARPG